MAKVVLDAGALLAYLRRESGSEAVALQLSEAIISVFDFADVLRIAVQHRTGLPQTLEMIVLLQLLVVPFGARQAEITAQLAKSHERIKATSLLPCSLALGVHTGRTVLTTNPRWKLDSLEVSVELIR